MVREVWVCILQSLSGRWPGKSISVRLTILSNTDKNLVEYIAGLLGNDKRVCVHRTMSPLAGKRRGKVWKQSWIVKISRKKFIKAVLDKIKPHMVSKRVHADLLLEFIVAREQRFHLPYSDEELEMVKLSKEFNKRG